MGVGLCWYLACRCASAEFGGYIEIKSAPINGSKTPGGLGAAPNGNGRFVHCRQR